MTKGFFHVPDLVVQDDDVPRHLAFDHLTPMGGCIHRRVLPLPRPIVDADPSSQVQVLALRATLLHIHRLPDGYQIPGRNFNQRMQFYGMLLVYLQTGKSVPSNER